MMQQAHGVAATAGHLASNGGIRDHSAGDVFPFILVGTGDDMWHVQLPNGRMFGHYLRAEQAEVMAHHLKEIRERMDIAKMPVAWIGQVLIAKLRGDDYFKQGVDYVAVHS